MKRAYILLAPLLCALSILASPAAAGKDIRKSITVNLRNSARPNVVCPGDVQVNTYNGNMLLQRQDVSLPARGLDLDVLFSYNSGSTKNDWGFGRGWTTSFNMMYERKPGSVIIRREDGQKDKYTGTGPYAPPVGVFDNLSEYVPGKFLLQSKYGVRYYFDDSTHKHLTKIEDPNGNALHFTGFLAWNQPQFITDPSGRSLRLAWTGGRLTQIVDSISSPPRTTSYQYDGRGNMVRAIDQAGNMTQYQYDARSRLVKITDPRSNSVAIAFNDSGAVTSVTTPATPDAPPTDMSFVYDVPGSRTLVSEFVSGAVQTSVYTFNPQGKVTRIQSNAPGYDVQYEYDAENNITRTVDANGNQNLFTCDSRGNRLTETDALSHVASWSYEPVFNQVTSATDKRGNTTSFAYDVHGNLLSVSKPLGLTETFTYDAFGSMITATDGRGNTSDYTYDAFGNPVSVVRPIGSESFSYDNSGNLTSWTDANGHTTTCAYDLLNRRISMTDPLPATTTYAYDANGNLVSVTDPNGHSATYAYDALDRVYSVTVPAGHRTLTRNARGNVLQDQDPNGHITQYAYDSRNRLVSIADPLGHSRSFTYDNNGNVVVETDFNGNLTTYLYDALDRAVSVTDALGHITTITYDPNDNPLTVTDANSHVTAYTYDPLNRRSTVIYPIGGRSYTYDQNDNVVTHTDPNGHTTTYTYDALDRPAAVLDPLLHTSNFTYDPAGNLLSSTDANGLTTAYGYDAAGRLISSTNPMLETVSCTYDPAGNRTSLSLPNGTVLTYAYDASDRVTTTADPLGVIETYEYDANSNLLTTTDGNGNTTQYTYDPLGRLTSVTAPLGQSLSYGYDNNSNMVSSTDGAGNTTAFTYDAVDRLLTEMVPGGATTTSGYDPVGNLVSILDGRGHTTSFTHDAMDRVTQIAFANGSFRQHTYNPGGNLTVIQDQNASTITYGYDAMDRLISRSFPDGTSNLYAYDNAGRMTSANNLAATITFTYDNADRVISEVLNGKTTSYAYNIPGRTVTTTAPGGSSTTELLDLRLRTTAIQNGGTPAASYGYDPASRLLEKTSGNGSSSLYGYNNNDWVTSETHVHGGVPFAGFAYTLDNRGFRSSVEKLHHPTNSERYVYDATTRLAAYKEGILVGGDIPAPLTQTQFTFDPIGNRTNSTKDGVLTTYVANTINAYTSITGGLALTPSYDANGNMTSDGTRTFGYDYMDRLQSAVDLLTNAAYTYDALGRRIQKVVNGLTTKYFFDGTDVIEERDGLDAVTATYVRSGEDLVSMTRGGGGGLAQTNYYHQNALGSVVAMTNDSGNVVERYEYDSFGKVSIYDSAYIPRPVSAIGNPYLFAGMELDVETGLYYDGMLHYHPEIGRFMQQDPTSILGDAPDTRNGYSYLGSNPTNFRKGWDGTIKGNLRGPRQSTSLDGSYGNRASPMGSVKITATQNSQSLRKGWDGTIKGNANYRLLISDKGSVKVTASQNSQSLRLYSPGQAHWGNARTKYKGWDGTIKGRIDDCDDGDARVSNPPVKIFLVGVGDVLGNEDALAGKHTKTGHVTLLKRNDNSSGAARSIEPLRSIALDLLVRADDGSAKHTKTGHVTLLKAYDDEPDAAARHTKSGHVTLLKAYDDEPDAAARHTKSGHVTLLKAYDDEPDAAARHTKSGHVTLLKRNADIAGLAVRGKVKSIRDMGSGYSGFTAGVTGSGKKEFKGHVTLLK
jgi:RHS repeat-associated protein